MIAYRYLRLCFEGIIIIMEETIKKSFMIEGEINGNGTDTFQNRYVAWIHLEQAAKICIACSCNSNLGVAIQCF